MENTALERGAVMEERQTPLGVIKAGGPVEEMFLPPDPGSMRILYNNCNGLQINEYIKNRLREKKQKRDQKYLYESRYNTKIGGVIGAMKALSVNVLCLSETQTAWEKRITRDMVGKELKRRDQYATMTASTSKMRTASLVKPGGTMICADGTLSSKVSEKGQDPSGLGRWCYYTFIGKNKTKLIIICAYRYCQGQRIENVGESTSFSQQYSLLRQKGIEKPDPQGQFITDMRKFVQDKLDDNYEVLLCLDANEEMITKKSKIKEMTMKLGLYDIAKEKCDTPAHTYTRKNSSRRIDFILGTAAVLESITLFQHAPDSMGKILGDHRALCIDLDIKKIMNLNTTWTQAPTSRTLKSNDSRAVKIYIQKVRKNLDTHNVFQRMKALLQELEGHTVLNEYQKNIYESIDNDVYRLCINAENKVKKKCMENSYGHQNLIRRS